MIVTGAAKDKPKSSSFFGTCGGEIKATRDEMYSEAVAVIRF